MNLLSSCEPTYPAKTLASRLVKIVQEEQNTKVTCRIVGKTLWVYLPLKSLIEDKKIVWKQEAMEKISRVLSVMQRMTLSTDAKLDFLALVAADTKQYGIELISIEYIPDIKEAMLERFSRGEFLLRNVRDININPKTIGDETGEFQKFNNISFEQFLSMQMINRVKILFAKNKQLSALFEVKSADWNTKFGTIKLTFEFLRKKYDLNPAEQAINPLSYAKMIAALVINTYDYTKIQAVEITDTFSQQSLKISSSELKKIKINLPEIKD